MERAGDFQPEVLLTMSQDHYENKVWPLMFYIPKENIGKWKMNAARSLGNTGDTSHVPILAQTLSDNPDETVRGMCAWSLGRLGGPRPWNRTWEEWVGWPWNRTWEEWVGWSCLAFGPESCCPAGLGGRT